MEKMQGRGVSGRGSEEARGSIGLGGETAGFSRGVERLPNRPVDPIRVPERESVRSEVLVLSIAASMDPESGPRLVRLRSRVARLELRTTACGRGREGERF